MIDKLKIRELNATPIELVAARLGLDVNRHKCLCPFHDDRHPSLSFDIRKNRFRCYVCDEHGGVIDLVMRLKACGFREACEWLGGPMLDSPSPIAPIHHTQPAKQFTPDIEYLNTLIARPYISHLAYAWLQSRRIDPRIIAYCRLTSIDHPTPCWRYGKPFYDAPSLLIPYFDGNGRLRNVQSRYLGQEDKPRFKFPRGACCHIYNLQILRSLRSGEELWVTEGCSDCWAMLSSGKKAIAIPSASMLKEQDLVPLREVNLHMYPDQDEPGERLFWELHKRLPQIQRHQLPTGYKDFGELYKSYHHGHLDHS